MKTELSLLDYCRPCGYKCCVRSSGMPRVNSKEKEIIEAEFGKNVFLQEEGYWVPRKKEDNCIFLSDGLCQIQKIKLVDCKIFPIDPTYDDNGQIGWVIDESCPAAEHLTPDFYATSIILGIEWIKQTNEKAFHNYWKKYKADNPEQKLVKLSEYLASKPDGFMNCIKSRLEELTNTNLSEWLKLNNSESLCFIVQRGSIKT